MLARALLLTLTACGALTAQIDEPQLCQTLPVLTIPPGDGGARSAQVALDLKLDLPIGQPGESHETVQLTQLTLTSGEDGGVMGSLDHARVVVTDPAAASGQPDAVALDYTRPPAVASADPLVLGGTDTNLAPYLSGGTAHLQLAFDGEAPAGAWTLNAQACFHVTATIAYAEARSTSP